MKPFTIEKNYIRVGTKLAVLGLILKWIPLHSLGIQHRRQHSMRWSYLIASIFISTRVLIALPQGDSGLTDLARHRHAALAKKYMSCDEISDEGSRLKCIQDTLEAHEAEILRLTSEVDKSLCPKVATTFKKTARAWATYYQVEKKHIHRLNKCQDTLALSATYSALVELASARCSYLISQLDDHRIRP
jgi:hypothetical protein